MAEGEKERGGNLEIKEKHKAASQFCQVGWVSITGLSLAVASLYLIINYLCSARRPAVH